MLRIDSLFKLEEGLKYNIIERVKCPAKAREYYVSAQRAGEGDFCSEFLLNVIFELCTRMTDTNHRHLRALLGDPANLIIENGKNLNKLDSRATHENDGNFFSTSKLKERLVLYANN